MRNEEWEAGSLRNVLDNMLVTESSWCIDKGPLKRVALSTKRPVHLPRLQVTLPTPTPKRGVPKSKAFAARASDATEMAHPSLRFLPPQDEWLHQK